MKNPVVRDRVLQFLKANPGSTTAQVARFMGWESMKTASDRLGEFRRDGHIRGQSATGGHRRAWFCTDEAFREAAKRKASRKRQERAQRAAARARAITRDEGGQVVRQAMKTAPFLFLTCGMDWPPRVDASGVDR